MTEAELDALAASIKEDGLEYSICMLDGLILDGRNRWLACRRAGVPCPSFEYVGPRDEESIRKFVARLNEHRRHLTPQWLSERRKARVERVVEARKAGESIRIIAEKENVSPAQVQEDIKVATVQGGCTVEPESGKVAGRDGKTRTAKPKAASTRGPAVAGRKSATKSDDVKDQLGTVLPSHLRDVFGDGKLNDMLAKVRSWRQTCETAALGRAVESLSPFNPHLRAKQASVREHLQAVYEGLEAVELAFVNSLPCAVCPRCGGTDGGCGHCDHAGFVPRWLYDQLVEHAELEAQP